MSSSPEQTALIDNSSAVTDERELLPLSGGRDPDAILEGLNDAQREAVAHLGGPLLIVAGAGSGKTRTLTRRFEWLVSQGVPVDRILALTYTNDAASELAERIEQVLGESIEDANATTFHSLCINVLRDEAAAANLNPFFAPATGPDRVAIVLSRLNELSFDHIQLRGNPAAAIGDLIEFIDRLKEECAGPERLLEYAHGLMADAVDPDARQKAELMTEQAHFYAMHEVFLREANVLDFGGMQFELYKLLSGNEDVRQRISRRFDHILVDEFQDTSYVQLEILKLLAADHGNIAAVGDDDQSIYRFRGANARSITDFGARFGEFKRVELELNYRSAPPIIDAARAIVGQIESTRRVEKNLTAAEDKPGAVRFWHCDSEVAEAQAIVTEIERLIAEESVAPREICVLVAKRSHVEVLADRLGVHEIPYVLTARDFFQRSEIRVPLSWLKVLTNPTLNEDAWRMLTAPPIGLESSEYALLMRWMSKNKHPHVVAAMRNAARGKQFTPETLDKIRAFIDTYDKAAEMLDELRPGEFVIRLINRIALKGNLLLRGDRRTPDRLANLGKLQRMAEDFATRRPQATAREFALYITAMAEAGFGEDSESAQSDPNAVRVMTAHGSKGLEFDYVFIPGMSRNRWPGNRTSSKYELPPALVRQPGRMPEGKDDNAVKRAAHVEDQRRLVHVAMTRARTQLVLSHFDAKARNHDVSEFFSEALEALNGTEEPFAERSFDAAEFVYSELAELRGELMSSIDEAGAELGEMRLDASSDTPADIARFTELLKLSALTHRLRQGQSVSSALPEVNDMLATNLSPAQRSYYENSPLDARLLASEQRMERLVKVFDSLSPQLGAYLPVTKDGMLRLSASDLGVYQRCPKMYEFEKVIRIPTREQSHLRLGILVHNVLERFHRDTGEQEMQPNAISAKLADLIDAAIAAGGWGNSDDDRQLLERARTMCERYADSEYSRPQGKIELETKFSLKLDPSPSMADTQVAGRMLTGIQVNGKIDRIERLADGSHRLLDYKTGKKKTKGEVQKDAQLVLYRLAASEVLGIEASELVYYYLEDISPAVIAAATDERVAEVRETINSVADAIVQGRFEPTPEYSKCKTCAFSHVCPATEA
ncbi:MAG TPA: ATP-dependent DNA helicase [Solirubrobacterales bacterium]|nr:ATP-dependent DNA helicase [Solirubrobacterales bacterium]